MPTSIAKVTCRIRMLAIAGIGLLMTSTVAAEPTGATKPEKSEEAQVEYLFVQTAERASFKDGTVTLHKVSPVTVFFSDRPARIAGHGTTDEFVGAWGEGESSFEADPPNAALAMRVGGEAEITDAVVTLRNPRLVNGELSYDVTVLEGEIPASAGATSLFIDPYRPVIRSTRTIARPTTIRAFGGSQGIRGGRGFR